MSGVRVNYNHIPQTQREIVRSASKLVRAVAFEVQRYAQQSMGTSVSAPGDPPGVKSGTLRASLFMEMIDPLTAIVGVGAAYGVHLEFGTSKMAARPFMLPALVWVSREVGRIAKDISWT